MKKKNLLSVGMLIIALLITSCNSKRIKSNDLENDKLKGKVKRVIIKHSGAFTKTDVFTYNLEGYKILEQSSSEEEYEDKNGYPSAYGGLVSYGTVEDKTEFSRDIHNNIIEETLFRNSPIDNFKIVHKNKCSYDENGNIISRIEINQNQNQEDLVTYKNKYDKNDNLIECINVTNDSKDTFKYDEENNMIEHQHEKQKTTYKYDDNNNIIYEGGYDVNSGGSRELKYDSNNNLIEEVIYSFQKKVECTIKHLYIDNQLKEDKSYNNFGELYSTTTYNEYDSQGNWTKCIQSNKDDNMTYNTERIIEYYSENETSNTQINNSKIEEKTQPVVQEEKLNENNNLKTLNEIKLTLIDGSLKKAKLYLGEPDKYEYGFGHYSKGFAIYYNKVSNQNGQPKHLVLFLRENGRQWGSDAQIEEIYAINDNEKTCFGIHCLKIKDKEIYTNALDLIVDKKYKSIN